MKFFQICLSLMTVKMDGTLRDQLDWHWRGSGRQLPAQTRQVKGQSKGRDKKRSFSGIQSMLYGYVFSFLGGKEQKIYKWNCWINDFCLGTPWFISWNGPIFDASSDKLRCRFCALFSRLRLIFVSGEDHHGDVSSFAKCASGQHWVIMVL